MPQKRFIVRARQEDYSLARYTLRIKEDSRLYDDVMDFMTKHDTSLDTLVNKLLNNHFSSLQKTD